MKTKTYIATAIAVLIFALTTMVFCSNHNAPFYQCPLEAINGIAFAFGWGLGFPVALAYVFAVITLFIPAIFFFYLTRFLIERWSQ